MRINCIVSSLADEKHIVDYIGILKIIYAVS